MYMIIVSRGAERSTRRDFVKNSMAATYARGGGEAGV